MATCRFCKGKLSWFSKNTEYHEGCFEKAKKTQALVSPKVRELISNGLKDKAPYLDVQNSLIQIASQSGMPTETLRHTVLDITDELAKEMPLDREAGNFLSELNRVVVGAPETFDVSALLRSRNPFAARLFVVGVDIESSVDLWNLIHAYDWNPPTPCPLLLQPGEKEVIRFGLVVYLKSVVSSSHVGGYSGLSIPIGSGVYYRFGGYSGQSVKTSQVQQLDTGQLYLTNKAIYLAGQQSTFGISYSSVLRFKAYPDGLGLFRSSGGGREEIFALVNVMLSPKN